MLNATVAPAFDGARLREQRLSDGLSQADFAAMLGVSRQCISLWEKSKRRPRPGTLARLAMVLHIAVEASRGR